MPKDGFTNKTAPNVFGAFLPQRRYVKKHLKRLRFARFLKLLFLCTTHLHCYETLRLTLHIQCDTLRLLCAYIGLQPSTSQDLYHTVKSLYLWESFLNAHKHLWQIKDNLRNLLRLYQNPTPGSPYFLKK